MPLGDERNIFQDLSVDTGYKGSSLSRYRFICHAGMTKEIVSVIPAGLAAETRRSEYKFQNIDSG